jgi:hypothetical protein
VRSWGGETDAGLHPATGGDSGCSRREARGCWPTAPGPRGFESGSSSEESANCQSLFGNYATAIALRPERWHFASR